MDQFYTSSITSSIQFYPFERRRRGGKRARAVPWVVPWLSRGLSHGCPRGCPAGCPVVVPWVVPRLSRGGPPGVPWFRIRAHRHMNVCLAVSICMREHTLKCAQTCKHGNSEKPPNTCSPDGARTKSVHTRGGKTMWHDNNDNCMMHLPRTPLPQTQS